VETLDVKFSERLANGVPKGANGGRLEQLIPCQVWQFVSLMV